MKRRGTFSCGVQFFVFYSRAVGRWCAADETVRVDAREDSLVSGRTTTTVGEIFV